MTIGPYLFRSLNKSADLVGNLSACMLLPEGYNFVNYWYYIIYHQPSLNSLFFGFASATCAHLSLIKVNLLAKPSAAL
jgi:hypothetical protein